MLFIAFLLIVGKDTKNPATHKRIAGLFLFIFLKYQPLANSFVCSYVVEKTAIRAEKVAKIFGRFGIILYLCKVIRELIDSGKRRPGSSPPKMF